MKPNQQIRELYSPIVTREGKSLKIGTDFVDAVTGKEKSHGSIELKRGPKGVPMRYDWKSTQDIAASEHLLRALALREGVRVTNFQSQAA